MSSFFFSCFWPVSSSGKQRQVYVLWKPSASTHCSSDLRWREKSFMRFFWENLWKKLGSRETFFKFQIRFSLLNAIFVNFWNFGALRVPLPNSGLLSITFENRKFPFSSNFCLRLGQLPWNSGDFSVAFSLLNISAFATGSLVMREFVFSDVINWLTIFASLALSTLLLFFSLHFVPDVLLPFTLLQFEALYFRAYCLERSSFPKRDKVKP